MTISDRDRKILIVLIPLVLLLGYWFLLISPKRQESATAGQKLAKEQDRLGAARQKTAQLSSAKTDFARDYEELVELGKAVPTSVDVPSLIVQLESAAHGTHIRFSRIAKGERSTTAAAAPAPPAPGSGNGSQPAAAGGAAAQSGSGKVAEKAGDNVQSANNSSAATANQAGSPSAGTATGAPGTTGAPGLDTVPLDLEFQGRFLDLADFFHRLKRFVRLSNGNVQVRGRLMSVEGLKFTSDPDTFPLVKAEIKASVYLTPKDQGKTAGAGPQGPATAAPASSSAPVTGSAAAPAPTSTPPASP